MFIGDAQSLFFFVERPPATAASEGWQGPFYIGTIA